MRAPERRGFGTPVIERSIPHELKGRAEVRYRLGGVEADFVIPARLVSENREKAGMETNGKAAPKRVERSGERKRPLARALVLEDSMIIAMDTEDNLRRLGVRDVVVASSVDHALAEIERADRFDLALLDFNLGDESSERVAERLAGLDVPFWFVTGYGDAIDKRVTQNAMGILKKPFALPDLERALEELQG